MTEARQRQRPAPLPPAVLALRPKQWLKNVLVFAVPLAAGRLLEPAILGASLVAFLAFCLASSATYLVNDLVDRDVDRAHPTKRHRPIAAGTLAPRTAFAMAIALVVVAAALGFVVTPALGLTVIAYVVVTLAYSLWLKHEAVIELALVAMGFLLRAVAGAAATSIPVSKWFIIVAGFGSLFMAAGKRYSELVRLSGESRTGQPTRRSLGGYTAAYLRFVWAIAAAVTITAYCLWSFGVGSPATSIPWSELSVLPFVLALLRYAVVVDAAGAEEPEQVILRDPVLLILGVLWLGIFAAGAAGA